MTALVAVLLLAPCRAIGLPLQLPTTALQESYREQHTLRAESSEALARALLYTAQRAPRERRLAILQQACQIAPSFPEPHLQRARFLILQGDVPGAALALRDAATAARRNATQTALWGLRLSSGTLHVLSGALLVLVILLVVRTLPFLEHRLGTRTRAPRAVLLAGGALLLWGLLRFPIPMSLLALALLSPLLLPVERRALMVLCLALAGTSWLLLWQAPETLLADPGHRLALLARANVETLSAEDVHRLEQDLPSSPERDIVLGLQAARRQLWQKAHRRYVAAQAQDSTWAPTYTNLANLFFALQDFERAATGYRTAQTFDATDPVPHANLAQAYIQMLQYEESDHELSMANSLGFEATAREHDAWNHEENPVRDATLSASELRHLASAAAAQEPQATRARLLVWRGAAWRGVPLTWMPWVCKAEDEAPLTCPRCDMLATRRAGTTVGDGTPASRRPKRFQQVDRAPQGMALLFPGAAFFVSRSPVAAIFTVVLACATWNLPTSTALATAVFLVLYLPGLLRARNSRPVAGA